MSSLRSSLILSRPSIRDLTTFLFSPSTRQCTHCITSRAPTAAISPRRAFSAKSRFLFPAVRHSTAPKSHDRGPASIEDTQTDFGALNVLGNTPVPSTSIDACLWDGFHLNSGVKIVGGQGVLLVGGEAFAWCPWEAEKSRGKTLVDGKGRFDVEDESWGLLGLVWPKPDILILGLGKDMRPISPRTREYINSLGIRIDIQDTRNAAAQFNLLATERGVGSIAAALVPIGWREGVGVK